MKIRITALVALAALVIGIWQWHANALTSRRLAGEIVTRDLAAEDVTEQLITLSRFVATHMNASVRLELAGSYQRAVARAEAAATPPMNSGIYAQAAQACGGRSSSVAQAECTRQFVSARLEPPAVPQPTLPDRAKFQHNYRSPGWTPDLAGLMLLASVMASAAVLWQARRLRYFDRRRPGLI